MSLYAVGERAWRAAKAMSGVPFRLQGRDPATGLDCAGLVIAAYGAAGVRLCGIDSYALRGFPLDDALAEIGATGLIPAGGNVREGDVGLFNLGAGQLHIALLAPALLIHADAGLRRVAQAPANRLPPPIASWRWN